MNKKENISVYETIEDIELCREIWNELNWHPNTDIDHYLTVIDSREEVLCPYIIVIREEGIPKSMLIGRIEDTPFSIAFGYKTLIKPIIRHLTILYGGILGKFDLHLANEVINFLRKDIKRKYVEVICFSNLQVDTDLFQTLRTVPSFLLKDHIIQPSIHWQINIPDSYSEYFSQLPRRTRSNFNNYSNKIKKTFKENYELKIYSDVNDLQNVLTDIESITQKTYHRQLGVGFFNNDETYRRFKLGFEKKWLNIYILYINQNAVAYWVGWKYGDIFYTDFTGYDPEYNDFRVGNFVLLQILEMCCNNTSINKIDFGFGDAQYKKILSNQYWEEATLYIFTLSIKNILINSIRTLIYGISKFAQYILIKTNSLEKIKKIWRTKKVKKSQ